MPTRNDDTMKKFLAIIFGILFAFLIAEVILRLISPILFDQFTVFDTVSFDPELGHKFREIDVLIKNGDNVNYKLTTIGIKGVNIRDSKFNGQIFAVAVGDSFTLSDGVNLTDAWTEVLERRLNKSIVNMGVYSYNTISNYKMLEMYGMKFSPDIVFFGFSRGDTLESEEFSKSSRLVKDFLNEYSYFYRFVKLIKHIAENTYAAEPLFYSGNTTVTLIPDFHFKGKYNSIEFQNGISLVRQNILAAKTLAEIKGAKFILILFPGKEQVYSPEISELTDAGNLDFFYESDSIKKFCIENNMECIDLLTTFTENKQNQLFYNVDGHPNKEGNKLIADSIYKYLKDKNFINQDD